MVEVELQKNDTEKKKVEAYKLARIFKSSEQNRKSNMTRDLEKCSR
jgi:hypothetical protein